MVQGYLVEQLYDAAARGISWRHAVESIAAFAQADICDILLREHPSGAIRRDVPIGFEDACMLGAEALNAYVADYATRDVTVQPALRYPKGSVWTIDDLVGRERWLRSTVYNEFFSKHGRSCLMGVALPINPKLSVAVALGREDHPFDHHDRERFQPLLKPIAQAVDVAIHLDALRSSEEVAWHMLDHLADAVFALGHNGNVLYANAKGEALRAKGLSFHRRSRLSLKHGSVAVRVGDTLHRCELRPAPPRLARLGATVLAFIAGAGQREMPTDAALRAAFDLTPAEARLARSLAQGHSVRSCCDAFQIAEPTCRAQLKSIFRKTDTSRQPELVLLILESFPRLRPEHHVHPRPQPADPPRI